MISLQTFWFIIGLCTACFIYYIQVVIEVWQKIKRRKQGFIDTLVYDIGRLTEENRRMENTFIKHAQRIEDLEYAINRTSCELMRIEAKIDIEIRKNQSKMKKPKAK